MRALVAASGANGHREYTDKEERIMGLTERVWDVCADTLQLSENVD